MLSQEALTLTVNSAGGEGDAEALSASAKGPTSPGALLGTDQAPAKLDLELDTSIRRQDVRQ